MAEPLFLESVMQEKIWGGTRLREEFSYEIPSEQTGEYWAISAHPNGVSKVKNGLYKDWPLDKLYQQKAELFGSPKSSVFPLLVKILDANDWLSVQVHPDDVYALEHEGELGKTECWYVLAADPGAEIIYGHNAQSKEELAQLIQAGDWDKLLSRVPVKAGDFFYVPSGTMHAIGKGILILETQQSSDTTYRVYDFDRPDQNGQLRDLHIQQSIDVMTIGQPENSHPDALIVGGLQAKNLVSNAFFAVSHWQIDGQVAMKQTVPYLLLSVLSGEGNLIMDHQSFPLEKGDHFILPSDVLAWEFQGHLEVIASHPNDKD